MKILHKIEYVLLPRFSAQKGKELQNWDLWGPLLICLILCMYNNINITIFYLKELCHLVVIVQQMFLLLYFLLFGWGVS
jgi:hypothetical protein